MKLRNKKTGKIGNFCYGYTNELCVSWQKDDGFWEKQEYNSLAELNEEWCDYEEPKEYWHIFGTNITKTKEGLDEVYDKRNKQIGNYFETKEEAEKAVEKLKAVKRLKDKGFKFRWIDMQAGQIKYSLFLEKGQKFTTGDEDDLLLLFGGEE